MVQTKLKIPKTLSSNRVKKLRQRMLVLPSVCIERGYWMTESYKQTEAEPFIIRRAKALYKILQKMTISIEEDELIIGRPTSKIRAGYIQPEIQWSWYMDEMETLPTRDWDKFAPLSESEKSKLRGYLPYWKGKSLQDKWLALIPEDALKLVNKIQTGCAYSNNNQYYGHSSIDYHKLLSLGLLGMRKQIREEARNLNLADVNDFQKHLFLKSVDITLNAAILFARRYARLARRMALKETNTKRKDELLQIAENCERVPAYPARSFYEALQSVWLVYVVLLIEGWGAGASMGRSDQYLYPYYKNDIAQGKLTASQARELLGLFIIKTNEFAALRSGLVSKVLSGYSTGARITLGGVDKNGIDATNELSYLFLDAEGDVALNQEDFIVRVHQDSPDPFLFKACEIAKITRGKLKFTGDKITIQQLLNDGKPLECARDYHVTGCHSPGVPAVSLDLPGGIFNLPLMIEVALNNGKSRLTGEQIGPQTGDPLNFKSYSDVWEAYKKQIAALIPVAIMYKNVDKQLYPEYAPTPFLSGFFDSCVEKGLDIADGGTNPYVTHAISLGGAPNAGDSLAAIKKVVFEDKKITMAQLLNALNNNFEGESRVLHLLEEAPKFGNDIDYVDSIVNDVLVNARNEAARIPGFKGAVSNVAASTITSNVPLGWVVGALPDGRKAGEPIAEGGISPHQGRNVSGPTATMRSVAKLDLVELTDGSVLNMKFNPDALKNKNKVEKLASMIKTFCETGGTTVQFNIVSTDMLRDAQKHPENYRDLLVRVATYSTYFVELSTDLQNDIINRLEFSEV